jgi:ABC-2 type transport system ATP-binding protein
VTGPAVSLRGLTKRFGKFTAVDKVSLEVHPGEIVGFLGLNGAGKTTTIRILLDLLRPSAGNASIFGHDCQEHSVQARSLVGYLPAEMGIYSELTGRETLDLLGGLGTRPVDKQYRSELEARLELSGGDLRRKLREYSTGMKRKLGLVQAFQADPPLLILDEPTEGLDPLMQGAFHELLTHVREKGRAVFMSSHTLPEVERVCDRIALLSAGELVLLSTVAETRKLAARRVRISFNADVTVPLLAPQCEMTQAQPRAWDLRVEGELGPLLQVLGSLPVKDMEIEEARLEDILVKYYRDGAR